MGQVDEERFPSVPLQGRPGDFLDLQRRLKCAGGEAPGVPLTSTEKLRAAVALVQSKARCTPA